MSRLIRVVMVAAVAVVSVSVAAAVPDAAEAPVQLQVATEQPAYHASEPVTVRLTLKNVSKTPVWVTTRFFVSSPEVAANRRDIYLEITAPSGERLPITFTHVTGFPKTDLFKELQPGEEITSEARPNLRYLADLKAPGQYQVVAVYENVFGPEIGLETFRGVVRSSVATFTITP